MLYVLLILFMSCNTAIGNDSSKMMDQNPLTVLTVGSLLNDFFICIKTNQKRLVKDFLNINKWLTIYDMFKALECAIEHDAKNSLHALLDHESVELCSDMYNNYSILHIAVAHRKPDYLKVILSHHKMSPKIFNHKSHSKQTALQYAKDRRKYAQGESQRLLDLCIQYLEEYESDITCCGCFP